MMLNMKILLLFLSLLALTNLHAQSKLATLEWIQSKFQKMKVSNEIDVCCEKDKALFCYRTTKIQEFGYVSTGKDSAISMVELFVTCNYEKSGVPNADNTNVREWQISIYDGKNSQLSRVTVEKPQGCWEGDAYLITFYSTPDDKGYTAISADFATTWTTKITFAANLDFEENLAERLQKAFNHFISLNKKKETF